MKVRIRAHVSVDSSGRYQISGGTFQGDKEHIAGVMAGTAYGGKCHLYIIECEVDTPLSTVEAEPRLLAVVDAEVSPGE